MMFFDQLSTIHNHLSEIKYNTRSSKKPAIDQVNDSSRESSKYVLKMINAYLQEGTVNAVRGILPKNKRKSNKLTRKRLKSRDDWTQWEWRKMYFVNDLNSEDGTKIVFEF